MLVLLSPAKNLDLTPSKHPPMTEPRFIKDAVALAKLAKKLKAGDLKRLMGISDDLAQLNVERYKAFDLKARCETGTPAAHTFAGDVYRGLDARSMTVRDLQYAQDHLRILSGLYGLLRPLDAIQPYRLEMGVKLNNPTGEDLYDYWRPKLAKQLDALVETSSHPAIVNLASNEYFKAVDRKKLKAPVLEPVFQDVKDGKARTLFMFAKRARGLMARWIVENRVDNPGQLKEFDVEGYKVDPRASHDGKLVFKRPQPPPVKGAKAA